MLPAETRTITAIQLLRFLAAFGVVAIHCVPSFEAGAVGVDVFFVISGFIIVVASRNYFGASGAPWTFLRRRILRVVPLYWIATLGVAAREMARGEPFGWGFLASSLFFVPHLNEAEGNFQPIVRVGWTLNFEMFFYVIFAAALLLPMRPALVAVAFTLTFLVLAPIFDPASPFAFYWSGWLLLEFTFGMGVAWLYLSGARLPLLAGVLLVVLGATVILLFSDTGNDAYSAHRVLVWGLPSALIVGAAAMTPWPSFGEAWRLTTNYLGDASYAVYLFHLTARKWFPDIPKLAEILLVIAACVAIHASYEAGRHFILTRRSRPTTQPVTS